MGVEGLLDATDRLDTPNGSAEDAEALPWAALPLLLPRVWALADVGAPNGSLLRAPKGSELEGAEAAGASKGSWDAEGVAAGGPKEHPKGSLLPNASGAAAGVSLDVEKVDQTSAPGDAACTIQVHQYPSNALIESYQTSFVQTGPRFHCTGS